MFSCFVELYQIVSSVSVSFFQANPPGTPEKSWHSQTMKKKQKKYRTPNIKYQNNISTYKEIMSKPYRNHVHHIETITPICFRVTQDHVPKSYQKHSKTTLIIL